jgi:Cof subfamily protein (haloacid dehalogenase superfamily)
MVVPGLQTLRDRYDAILIDLDGTLLDGQGRLSERSVAAVRALEQAGLKPIVCTGRSIPGTRRIHRQLGLATPVVAYNGAWIGPLDGAPVVCHPIPDAHTPHVLDAEGRACFSFRHHGEKKFTFATDHAHHPRVISWYENVVHLPRPCDAPTSGLMRVSLFFESHDHGDATWQALHPDAHVALHRETFPLAMFPDFADSHLVLCEIQRKGRGKAAAYDFLAEHHGIEPGRVVAVGDQTNDLSMLREAGLAVAMGNAVEPLRALAHLVIGHHAEEGFAAWVESGAPHPEVLARSDGARSDAARSDAPLA